MWRHGVTEVRCHGAGIIMSCGKMARANETDRGRSESNVFEFLSIAVFQIRDVHCDLTTEMDLYSCRRNN